MNHHVTCPARIRAPALFTAQAPARAVTSCHDLRVGCVRTTARLGQSEDEHAPSAREVRQVGALLRLIAEQHQRLAAKRSGRTWSDGDRLAPIAEGNAHQHQLKLASALAVVLRRDGETEQSHFTHFANHVLRHELVSSLERQQPRCHAFFGEVCNGLEERKAVFIHKLS